MPRPAKAKSDDNTSILEYALSHLERESAEILAKIAHVKSQLGRFSKVSAAKVAEETEPAADTAAPVAGTRRKRVLSPAARKRIALAQKRRWAAHRKAKAGKE